MFFQEFTLCAFIVTNKEFSKNFGFTENVKFCFSGKAGKERKFKEKTLGALSIEQSLGRIDSK